MNGDLLDIRESLRELDYNYPGSWHIADTSNDAYRLIRVVICTEESNKNAGCAAPDIQTYA